MATLLPRKKSPRAPSFSLGDAIEKTAKIYAKERLHTAPSEIVAQHMGYKGVNNGSALQALASLRYYGLIERPSEGKLCVSRLYESYHYAPDEKLKKQIVVGWLRQPEIFAELLEKYPEGLPSDGNLRHELIVDRGFSPPAAQTLINILRSSIDFASYYESSAEVSDASDSSDDDGDDALRSNVEQEPLSFEGRENQSTIPSAVGVKKPPAGVLVLDDAAGYDQIPVRLAGGRKAWLAIPTPFYQSDKDRLKAQIDLLLEDDLPKDDN